MSVQHSTYAAILADDHHIRAHTDTEPDTGTPCQAWECPRPGIQHHGLILCAYHRGTDTTSTRNRRPWSKTR